MKLKEKDMEGLFVKDNEDSEAVKNDNLQENYLLKSLAVQNQINQWEKLVEVCIHFEKCIQIGNILPASESFKEFSEKEDFANNINETTKECETLLKNMLELQNLNKSNNETAKSQNISRPNVSKKTTSNYLQKEFENYRSYRNSTLQKWYSRTYVATDTSNLNVNKKIEDLMSNKNYLINRSQKLNQHYLQKIFPKLAKSEHVEDNSENKIVSGEVYDDTDFYLSLLQEVIDSKSSSGDKNNIKEKLSVLNMARQKMKRSAGKKASKGRKIRFTVHNKLVNFMPVNPSVTYEDDQKNVLFQSLFSL